MDHLAHIRTESAAFLQACMDGDPRAPVASCPGWTIADLLGHLGVVQRFHGRNVGRGVTDPPTDPRPTPPAEGLEGWFREGTDALVATLERVGADTPAWNFLGRQPLVSGFWHRRMVHEAVIHRWDAQDARGRPQPIDPEVAQDGIDEVLDTWVPARRPADAPGGVVVVRAGEVERVLELGEGPRAIVAGAPEEVLLALWRRLPLDPLVEGDLALVRSITTG